jgi:ABC-type branched-subunit amino acid transport system permease subunit
VLVVGTVGILLATEGLLYEHYGAQTLSFPDFLPTTGFRLEGITISWGEVISGVFAAGAAVLLYLWLERSRTGVAMRGVVDNPTLAGLSGERPERLRLIGWCVGAGFAAAAGILLAPSINLDVNLLALLVVQAFGACAVGRFVSLPLTFVGGLIVGVLFSLLTRYLTHPPLIGLGPSAPFIVLIVVLLVTPTRRLPRSASVRRSVVSATTAVGGGTRAVIGILGAVALIAVPHVVGTHLPVFTTGVAYTVVFGSLALLTWASGQLSLCHAVFLAVGATVMSHLVASGVPWLPALALAGLAAVPVGILVALPAVRLSGIYLGLLTLGFGILMQDVAYQTSPMFGTGLTVSIPRPHLGFINGNHDVTLYYIVLAVAVVCLALMCMMWRGRMGRFLRALAEAPTMLVTQGLQLTITRLLLFSASAFFAAIGGALIITQTGSASGSTFGPLQSLIFLAVLAIAGSRRLVSPILAALFLGVLPGYASGFGANAQLLVFGGVAIVAATILARRQEVDDWLAEAARDGERRTARSPVPAFRASAAS